MREFFKSLLHALIAWAVIMLRVFAAVREI